MRVMRADALPALLPIPTGLTVPVVLSTRSLCQRMRVREISIPYDERVGQSKLRVFRDGYRFLVSIVETAFPYKPFHILGFTGLLILISGFLVGG